MAIYLTKDMFEKNLDKRYWILNGSTKPQAVNLVEIKNGHVSPRQEQFSLHFRGDREPVLPQRIYTMKHDSIGEFELFLVPIGQDETGTTYEAVFNRLVQDQNQSQ